MIIDIKTKILIGQKKKKEKEKEKKETHIRRWIWFGFEVEFGDSIIFEVLCLGVVGICVSVGWS